MTNSPQVEAETVTTNADGTVTISMETSVTTFRVIQPSLRGWVIIAVLVVALAAIVLKMKRNSKSR